MFLTKTIIVQEDYDKKNYGHNCQHISKQPSRFYGTTKKQNSVQTVDLKLLIQNHKISVTKDGIGVVKCESVDRARKDTAPSWSYFPPAESRPSSWAYRLQPIDYSLLGKSGPAWEYNTVHYLLRDNYQ